MKNKLYGLLFGVCALILSGCGFEPLYKISSDNNVVQEAAKIAVEPVVGEGGYQMELILKEKLNANGISVTPQYYLKTEILEPTFYDQSIRENNFASLEKMSLNVKYQLIEKETNKILISSSVTASGSYNIIDEPYATVMAKEKMHNNLVRNLANDIVLHMMAYLKGKNQ